MASRGVGGFQRAADGRSAHRAKRAGRRAGRGSRGTTVAASALVAGLLLSGPVLSPASAATGDGFWYFDALNIAKAHDAGWTGEGVTIAVMDGPVNLEVPTLADADIDLRGPSGCFTDDGSERIPVQSTDLVGPADARHGTDVVSLISGSGDGYPGQTGVKGVAPDAKVLYYTIFGSAEDKSEQVKCLDEDGRESTDIVLAAAMDDAIDAGAAIISVSSLQTPGPELYAAQIRAVNAGVVVVGGMPNTGDVQFTAGWPGSANGSVGVQAADSSSTIATTDGLPNIDVATAVIAPGIGILTQGDDAWEDQVLKNGTSLATPIVASFLALTAQKYPDATGNQLVQNLIHTTGGETHEPRLDETKTNGYGFASVTGMLANDPSQYADENPLVRDTPEAIPTRAEFTAGYEAGTSPTPTAALPDGPTVDQSAFPVGVLVAIVVGVLVIAGIVVLVVVMSVRRAKSRDAGRTVGRS